MMRVFPDVACVDHPWRGAKPSGVDGGLGGSHGSGEKVGTSVGGWLPAGGPGTGRWWAWPVLLRLRLPPVAGTPTHPPR